MGVQAVEKQPSGNMSQETNNKDKWVKLTGPAAESLAEAFFGPAVVVLQDTIEGHGGAEEVTAEAKDKANNPLKKEMCNINRARRENMQPLLGRDAEGGCGHSAGKDTTLRVKPVSVSPKTIIMAGAPGTRKQIKVLKSYRIVLLGKTNAGKSSLANTIFGEDVFKRNPTPICKISQYQGESRSVHGRRLTVIDTPGFLDTDRPEEDMKSDIVRCITEYSPGPHVFLVVLKLETLTEQKQEAITKICQHFPEEVFKFAAVVFTHGDQLPEGMKIEEFVQQYQCLTDLVKKCSGRCHIVNNNYWKNNQQDGYRSNQFQVAEILNTIEKIVMGNKGGCYTSKMMQEAKREKQEKDIITSAGNMPQGNTSNDAINAISRNVWLKLTGPAAASLVEAFFGPNVIVFNKTAEGTGAAAERDDALKAEEEEEEEEEEDEDKKEKEEDEEEDNVEQEEEDDEEEEDTEDTKITEHDVAATENIKGKCKSKQQGQPSADGAFRTFLSSISGFFWGIGSLLLGVGSAFIAASTALFSAAGLGLGSIGAAAGACTRVASIIKYVLKAALGGVGAKILYDIGKKIWAVWKWVQQTFNTCKELFKKMQDHKGIILLVVVFYSLLFLSFCTHEPVAKVILFMFGVLIYVLLSVV